MADTLHQPSRGRLPRALATIAAIYAGFLHGSADAGPYRYAAPPGWDAKEESGMVALSPKNQGDVAAIYLYPPIPAWPDVEAQFAQANDNLEQGLRVANPTVDIPARKVTDDSGPTILRSAHYATANGTTWVLSTARVEGGVFGFSAYVATNPAVFQAHLQEAGATLSSIRIGSGTAAAGPATAQGPASAPVAAPAQTVPAAGSAGRYEGVVTGPTGPRESNGTISFVPPKGFTPRAENGVTVLAGPPQSGNVPCYILVMPPKSAEANLAVQAERIVNDVLGPRYGRYVEAFGRDVKDYRWEGVSGNGWRYVELFGTLGRTTAAARTLLIANGPQVVPVIGVTTSVECLGGNGAAYNDLWEKLFHSIELVNGRLEDPAFDRAIIGTWGIASANSAGVEIYAANGHYDMAGGVTYYYESIRDPRVIIEKSSFWPGRGDYSVRGARLTTMRRDGATAGQSVTKLFRIASMPHPGNNARMVEVLIKLDRMTNGMKAPLGLGPDYVSYINRESAP